MKTHDIHEVVRRTGATLRQIDHLVGAGLVKSAKDAPRRGMSREFSTSSARYIAVATRLLNWGLQVADIKEIIGTDRAVMNRALGFNKTFVDHVWEQLEDPERCDGVESLLVFRIVDPSSKRTLAYSHSFTTAESLVSAARTQTDFVVISMKGLAQDFNAADEHV